MIFTREFLDRIKKAVDLKALIEEYTVLTKIGDNVWSGKCPHPDHNDITPSFRLFRNKNGEYSWKCFGCQDVYAKQGQKEYCGTDCFAFVQWISDYKGSEHVMSFPESVQYLAKKADIRIESSEQDKFYKQNEEWAVACHKNLLPYAREYLYSRGLSDHDITEWLIGIFQSKENTGPVVRLTLPLFNSSKKIIGFSNRLLRGESTAKYKNSSTSSSFKKSTYFYGEHLISRSCSDIRISEGVFDVILANKHGLKNVVATLGTAFSQQHVLKIKAMNKVPTFIFDSDIAGNKGTVRAISLCNNEGISVNVCKLPEGQDLAEFAQQQDNLEEWVKSHSIPSWQYLLSDIAVTYEAALQLLRTETLTKIQSIDPVTETDKILMKTFVKERFGIML